MTETRPSSKNFFETIAYYRELRALCYERTLSASQPKHINLHLNEISVQAAQIADGWKQLTANTYRPQRACWSWMHAYDAYQRNCFKRFDIAVWQNTNLLGLCYGRPTKRKTGLKLEMVESSPLQNNPMKRKIFPLISRAAINYAMLLGANEIKLMNPVSDRVAKYYAEFDYEPVRNRLDIIEYSALKIEY